MERRKGDRREVRLKCYLGSPTMGFGRLSGISENISRTGILVTLTEWASAPDSIVVGQTATVDVQLPAEHDLEPRSIYCEGRVVRIASDDRQVHVAVRIKHMQFRDMDAGLTRLAAEERSPRYLM